MPNEDSYTSTGIRTQNNTPVKAAGSTTPRTLAERFADTINVKDYGAKGDGVTDDTAAFQAAAAAANGKSIFVPQGNYVVTQAVSGDFFSDGAVTANNITLSSADTADCVHKTGDETIAGTKTFSGPIVSSYGGGVALTTSTDASITRVTGGTGFAKGARIELVGQDATSIPGVFDILASKNTDDTYSRLRGTPEGSLTWRGNEVTTDDKAVHKTGAEGISGDKYFSGLVVFDDAGNRNFTNVFQRTINANFRVFEIYTAELAHGGQYNNAIFGPKFQLYSTLHPDANAAGSIQLLARKQNKDTGTITSKNLLLAPDGTFTWDGNKVLTGADVFLIINGPAIDTDVVLPSGGTWKYYYSVRNASNYDYIDFFSGEVAGGTNITSGFPGTSYYMRGIAIKTAD